MIHKNLPLWCKDSQNSATELESMVFYWSEVGGAKIQSLYVVVPNWASNTRIYSAVYTTIFSLKIELCLEIWPGGSPVSVSQQLHMLLENIFRSYNQTSGTPMASPQVDFCES